MSFKHRLGVFFVVACLLAGVSSLAAQERGSVRGVVKDTQGNALEGAKVSIAGSAIPQGRDYLTKKDGVFLFQAVPPGAYTVLVSHPSMADFAIEVLVNVDRQTAVNVEMTEVGRVSEEVTVQAVSPVIDLKSTEVSASWQKDLVEKLPMGRSYASLFQLAPGVADNRDFAPNAGGNKQDNVYLYDGSNITNPLFGYLGANFSEMDIQEVNIKRGGISAEFGRAAGMVTNAITKSGSNTVTGSSASSSSRRPSRPRPGARLDHRHALRPERPGDRRRRPAHQGPAVLVRLGQPAVLQDVRPGQQPRRRPERQDDLPRVLRQDHRQPLQGPPLLGQRPEQRLHLHQRRGRRQRRPLRGRQRRRVLTGSSSAPGSGRSANRPSSRPATTTSRRTTTACPSPTSATGRRSISTNLAAMGYFRTAAGYIYAPATLSGQYVGGASEFNTQNFFRDEVKLVLSNYIDFKGQSHILKFGFSYDDGGEWLGAKPTVGAHHHHDLRRRQRLPGPATITDQPAQDSRGRTYSLFVQDNITIADRLTLTLGLLMNRDEYSAKTGGTKNTFLRFSFDKEVQPRVGLTFMLFPRIGDKIYANWGRYNNMDNRSLARAAAPIRIFRTDAYFSRADGSLLAEVIQAGETGKYIFPGLKPTYSDEFVFGYSRPFARVWSVEVWGQYRTVKHVIEDFPTRTQETSPSTYVYGNLDGQTMSYLGYPEFTVGKARRVYKAASVEIKKQYSDNWSLTFMYTWSRLSGNWDLDYAAGTALFYSSSYIEDAPGLYIGDPDDPTNLRNGIMSGSRAHVMKLFGTWQFVKNATLGWFGRLQSGRPWEARIQDYYGNYYALRREGRIADAAHMDQHGPPAGLRHPVRREVQRHGRGPLDEHLRHPDHPERRHAAGPAAVRQETSYASPRKFALSFYLNF